MLNLFTRVSILIYLGITLLVQGCGNKIQEPQPITNESTNPDTVKLETIMNELSRSGLKPLDPSRIRLMLKKGEVAYYVTSTELLEDRTMRVARQGAVAGLSIKIMKGVSFRPGVFRSYPISKTDLKKIDAGDFIVTNQRVVFMGSTKDINVSYKKLMGITPYTDALQLNREGKIKRQFFKMTDPMTCLAHLTKAVQSVP